MQQHWTIRTFYVRCKLYSIESKWCWSHLSNNYDLNSAKRKETSIFHVDTDYILQIENHCNRNHCTDYFLPSHTNRTATYILPDAPYEINYPFFTYFIVLKSSHTHRQTLMHCKTETVTNQFDRCYNSIQFYGLFSD